MRHNRSIYVATAATLFIIIIVAYFFVSCSKTDFAKKSNQTALTCEKFTLKVSKEDGQRIEDLITTLGNTGTMGLAMKRRHLVKTGDILDQNVPPLQFLAYIFSRPKLALAMTKIRRSKMKYHNFVEGLGRNLAKESSGPCFNNDVEGFAEYLRLDKKKVKQLVGKGVSEYQVNKKSFKPLVNFLIDEKAQ